MHAFVAFAQRRLKQVLIGGGVFACVCRRLNILNSCAVMKIDTQRRKVSACLRVRVCEREGEEEEIERDCNVHVADHVL